MKNTGLERSKQIAEKLAIGFFDVRAQQTGFKVRHEAYITLPYSIYHPCMCVCVCCTLRF